MQQMEQRTLGRTGRQVSVVGLGTWQLGADWGDVSEQDALGHRGLQHRPGVALGDLAPVRAELPGAEADDGDGAAGTAQDA